MERSLLVGTRPLEIELTVLVALVLVALVAITVRIARDPSESTARWLMERSRAVKPVAPLPVDQAAEAEALVSVRSPAMAAADQTITPEWLDRLLGLRLKPATGPAVEPDEDSGPDSGRRVA